VLAGIYGSANSVSRPVALAGDQSVGFGINLDNCRILREGYKGGCASQLQAELNSYGHANLVVDGIFGDTTRQAVIIFQQEHGIVPADGIVGPATKAALDAAASKHLASPSTPSVPTSYVALGDSYSSGEGLADASGQYLPPTAGAPYECHRSSQAYSQYVTPKPDVFIPCSGQKIAGLTAVLARQDTPLNSGTGLVTLTIGGNDLNWEETVGSCVKWQDELFHFTFYQNRAACEQNVQESQDLVGTLKEQLTPVYQQVLKEAPNAQVRILTYPPIFPDRGSSTSGCRIGRLGPAQLVIASDVEKQFVSLEQAANQAIKDAVQSVRSSAANGDQLQWVDVESQFGGYGDTGHTISCGATGRPTPWVNAVRLDGAAEADVAADVAARDWSKAAADLQDVRSPASFHPTHEGQHQMYLALAALLPGGWR
jgi:lysophospholipase L1-like esterase